MQFPSLKNNIFFKIISIGLISLLLLIPSEMIEGLIHERESTQRTAVNEVSSKWGEEQTIVGPIISLPYNRFVKETSSNNSKDEIIAVKSYIHILPSKLKITGTLNPEKRTRGIYEIVVYNSELNFSGSFSQADLKTLDIDPKNIIFNKAEFVVGINDLRGIEEQVTLKWNDKLISFNSGVTSGDVIKSGINAILNLSEQDSETYSFEFNLKLKGSRMLYFTPVGKETDVSITSNWPNPKFNGSFLPDKREISEKGFSAIWNVQHLNRNYPQIWSGGDQSLSSSAFGIDLLLPVDSYHKTTRCVKYAFLFIAFTFIVFFFIEVLNKVFIHPIQYVLVGISLVIFFSLLLSISEHLEFNKAYIISAGATLFLIAAYVFAILKSRNLTILIVGILCILYTLIFVIIQLQDYALLIGSIAMFLILALVMYFSRKIDWYKLNIKEKDPTEN
jgi:inner membrane protein